MRLLERIALILILSLMSLYALDYVTLRFHIPPSRPALGSVDVKPEYVVRLKNGKDDISFGDPETDACANSLFPQMGYTPCWYARRHKNKEIDVRP